MPDASGRSVLLIDSGDLPSLVACLIQPDAGRLILWHPRVVEPAGPRRAEMAQRHAELLEAPLHVAAPTDLPALVQADAVAGATSVEPALQMTHAAVAALRLGAQRVVWPVQVGPHAAEVAAAVDQTTLVTELVHASAGGRPASGGGGLMIDVPLIDLDETQVVDLADDAGAPPAFWPCLGSGPEPCGVCADCARWLEAHQRLGLPWPWAVPAVPAVS